MMLDYFHDNFIENIQYDVWVQQDRCSFETHVKDSETFCEMFVNLLPPLRTHDFIAKKQAEYFKEIRDNLRSGEILVVADFSENYSFIQQNSVQGVHWNNAMSTVHPFACYVLCDGKPKPLNVVIISDYLEHSTNSVHCFQGQLITLLRQKQVDLKKIIYFSDGAASQYKNKYNMINLRLHAQDFGVSAEWHFFATSHGKGPSDGLGGTLKRNASRASLQGQRITTPEELYEWAKTNAPGINPVFVSKEDCNKTKKQLAARFKSAPKIDGIRSFHCAVPDVSNSILFKATSTSESGTVIEYQNKLSKKTFPVNTRSVNKKKKQNNK